MSQLKETDGGPGQISDEELASLLKRGVSNGFQLDSSSLLSKDKCQKRQIKRRFTPVYRRINTYTKSIKQYKRERNRRKKVLYLRMVEFRSQKQIAEKLGVSVSTVKRDLRKMRRYVVGQNNRAIRLMRAERHRIFEEATEGLSLRERFDYLSLEMDRLREFWRRRGYRGHYTILHLDMTQTDKWGIPKLSVLPRQTSSATMAYPYKVRVVVKGSYEGRTFEADLGGFRITQTTRW